MSITVIAILLILGLCVLVSVKRPVAGVVLYLIVYMVFNRHAWWGHQIMMLLGRASLLASLVLFFSCVFNTHRLNWSIDTREKLIYLFVIVAFIVSYGFGLGVHENSWKYLEKMFKLSIFLFLMLRVVHTLNDFNIIIWVLIGGAIFLSWQARLIGGFTGDGRLDNIGGPDFNEANAFAAFLVMSIVFLGFKLLKGFSWKKIPVVVGIAFMVNALLLTLSRAVFIGLFFGVVFFWIKSQKAIRKKIMLYSALGIAMFFFLSHEQYWERMGSIGDESRRIQTSQNLFPEDTISRIDFWIASIEIFRDHPMGIGVKNFEEIVPRYDPRNPGKDAHNTYVLCYSEIGIIGIIVFLLIILSAFFQLKRIKALAQQCSNSFDIEMSAMALATILIIYLTGPMVTHSYLYSEFLWILLALPICLEKAVYDRLLIENLEIKKNAKS